jgi:hypothetical protein
LTFRDERLRIETVQKPVTPVVQIQIPAHQEVGVPDVLLGSIFLIGVLILAAAMAGLLAGGAFILYRRWRDRHAPQDEAATEHTRLDLSSR